MKSSVYSSPRLNNMHAVSMGVCILVALCKCIVYGLASYTKALSQASEAKIDQEHLILSRAYQTSGYKSGDRNDEAIDQTTWACFGILIFLACYYLYRFYIVLLVKMVETKQFAWFKVFTCCRWELRSFVRSHMIRDASVTGETIGGGRH